VITNNAVVNGAVFDNMTDKVLSCHVANRIYFY